MSYATMASSSTIRTFALVGLVIGFELVLRMCEKATIALWFFYGKCKCTGQCGHGPMWRRHSCLPCRDFPGTSAQTIGNKESVAPRFLPPETIPPGTVCRSSRHVFAIMTQCC